MYRRPCRPATVMVAVLVSFACGAPNAGPAQIEIELRDEVVAQQRQVRLGDVAYMRTTDLAAIRRLVALPLGEAPPPGTEAVLDRSTVARWIRGQLGISAEQLMWRGAQQSHLKGRHQVLPATQIEQSARAALEQWLAIRSKRFDIESSGTRQDLQVKAGKLELKVRPMTAGTRPSSRMVVWVDVWVDGAFTRTIPVSFSVEAYGEAWVTRWSIPFGAALVPAMLERAEVNLAAQPSDLLAQAPTSTGEASNLRSVRSLKAGEPLSIQNTRSQLAVNRGDWVMLQLSAGTVRLESRAEALQEGGLGQTVRVRVAGAANPVEAIVVDRGRVEAMP